MKRIRDDESVVVIPADKGQSTVVMDRSEHNQKIGALLSDTTTYLKLKKDPATSLECKMNELLLALNKVGSIPDPLYKRLKSSGGMTPLF